MLNFGASKPRVKRGGVRAPRAPPGSAPDNTASKTSESHLTQIGLQIGMILFGLSYFLDTNGLFSREVMY